MGARTPYSCWPKASRFEMSRPLVHIIDGSGYIFRAFYAVRSLSTASGDATNAVYGFSNMLEKLLREDQPSHLAIVFDAGGDNFRHEIFPDYKSNRSPPPEDLTAQIPHIHRLVDVFRIRRFVIDGVEADDVIATLTRMAIESDRDVRLITGDKDLMQLVGDRVTLWEPMRSNRFTPPEVEEKMGVPPALVADALALAGDSSDNIPGVTGIGPKKAAQLLLKHGDLQGVLQAAADGKIKGKMGQNLAEQVEMAQLSRKLVELRADVEVGVNDLEELVYDGPDKPAVRKLYQDLEFRKQNPKLGDEEDDADPAAEGDASADPTPKFDVRLDTTGYRVVTTQDELTAVAAELAAAPTIAFAIELTTGSAVDADVIGLAVQAGAGKAAYIPIGHTEAETQLEWSAVVEALTAVFEDPEIRKVSAESKPLVGMLARSGVTMRGLAFDTTLGSYLLLPDETQHGAEAVARRFLEHEPLNRTSLTTVNRRRRTFDAVPVADAARHVAERSDIAFVAAEPLRGALKEADVLNVMKDVELPLIPVLASMERAGITVDTDQLAVMSERFGAELERLKAECYEAAGKEFNIGSPKQLQKILFEELKLKIIKNTKTGPSTDQSVLEALMDAHPLPGRILEYRQVEKLKSTYVDALPKMVSPHTGRVHTQFNQATAATGRLSSKDPNLQNIPIRTELGREMRKVFVAAPGHQLVSVDYSQVELRVLAHFCEDDVLMSAFRDGADVHTRTAAALFQIPPEEVDREKRTQAKAVNFGVLYGMGIARLMRDLKITRALASKFMKDYFERQPGVQAFIDATLEQARATGEVRTLMGRRRLLRDVNSKNRAVRKAAERMAVNTPIQGSAADLIKLAMIRVWAVLAEEFPAARLLLQVHDELLVEVPEDDAEAVAQVVQQQMENIFPLKVPLDAEARMGANWDDAH